MEQIQRKNKLNGWFEILKCHAQKLRFIEKEEKRAYQRQSRC
jgi:hypothetical protein